MEMTSKEVSVWKRLEQETEEGGKTGETGSVLRGPEEGGMKGEEI